MEYNKMVQEVYNTIKGKDENIQGQNKYILDYYWIWKGAPKWLKYTVWYNNQEHEAKYKTFNLPRQITRVWANNYANEGISFGLANKQSTDRLHDILLQNHFFDNFNNFTEGFFGVGSGAIVVSADSFIVDKDTKEIISNKDAFVKVTFVGGRRVVPITVEDGKVTECAFVIEGTRNTKLVLHVIGDDGRYQIYEVKGSKNTGGKIDWDYDSMAMLQADTIPLFTFWHPNITDDDDIDGNIGTSIFSMALDAFEMCDLVFTAFWKEIKYGQKVKFVKAELQPVGVDENGKAIKERPFDPNDESVVVLPPNATADSLVQEINGELRTGALVQTLNTYMNIAGMLCGLGSTSFEFDSSSGRPIQTATGIIAKQTELYRNVIKQENFAKGQLITMIQAIAWVNNNWTNNKKIDIKDINKINIQFDDNIIEDTQTQKENALKEVNAGVKSKAEYRSEYNEEDEETSLAYLQQNGMLINEYLQALQVGAMTPKQFVDFVYGPNCKDHDEIVAYITAQFATQNQAEEEQDYNDESEDQQELENNIEVENDKIEEIENRNKE